MNKFLVTILAFWNDITDTDKEKGATAVEYGLLVALIAAAIITIVATLGTQIAGAFQAIVTQLTAHGF